MATRHRVDEPVEEGGLVCGFCDERPFCVAACPATMFYMYANNDLLEGVDRNEMSRLYLNQDEHVHLPRWAFSWEMFEKMGALLKKHCNANPSAMPSQIRTVAILDLIS